MTLSDALHKSVAQRLDVLPPLVVFYSIMNNPTRKAATISLFKLPFLNLDMFCCYTVV